MNRLNIACGPNMFANGWENTDRVDMNGYLATLEQVTDCSTWPQHQQTLVGHVRKHAIKFTQHDLRGGFPTIPDGTVDAIYLGQMIEHLNPIYEIPKFLRDVHRMLRTGGVVRITTPDLNILLDAYLQDKMDRFAHEQPEFYGKACSSAQLAYLMYGANGPDCTFDNYEGHFVCFSRKHMVDVLVEAGFHPGAVSFRVEGESGRPELFHDVVDAGMSHSLCCEAVK